MMSSDKNRGEYQRRVNRVLDHIRAHRDEELTLEGLAEVAGFSPFHFHRIFKSMTGENLKEHIQRTRIESAAGELIQRPHVDILAIAIDSGFGSASAFARAFKERFAMSPTQWRLHRTPPGRKTGQSDSNPGTAEGKPGKAAPGAILHPASSSGDPARNHEEQVMKKIDVKVQTLPTWRVAYLRHIGPYGGSSAIADLWGRIERWASARDLWTRDRICLGISHDDPKVTEPAKCRYDAAIVIPPGLDVGGDVNEIEVKGGKYAMSPFAGQGHEIGAHYNALFAEWLPGSGYQPDNRFIFELHQGEFFDQCTGNVLCQICVPVRPL
jgi:AraC family transcriptional regulator